MAATSPQKSNFDDDLDSLLNYDINMPDAASKTDTGLETSGNQPIEKNSNTNVDEEIKIARKRQPVPKLDQNRLLSAAGIPRLRKIHKDKLKLKGKGHEFSDIARLLNMYQLWLDDLYPRAKFADALLIVEKLGHSKTLQMMRKQWIDEGRPKSWVEDEANAFGIENTYVEDQSSANGGQTLSQDDPAGGSRGGEYDTSKDTAPEAGDIPRNGAPSHNDRVPEPDEMDELDALLAEQEAASGAERMAGKAGKAGSTQQGNPPIAEDLDEFADEMEAMAGMDVPW